MGQYNKAIITAAGESLIAKAIVGEIQLNITKAKTSDHKYPDNTYFKDLTDMQGIKQVMTSPETKVLSGDLIQTRTLFSNEEVTSTYYIQNIGLYAMDGAHEVLFCIVTAATPDEMPLYNGVASTSYIYNIQNAVQDAAEINIEVVPSGTATIQDVMERVDATGGDISETVIETLEPIDTKYPVPSAGESTKVFMGKVKKYIEDTKPLDTDMTVYVATTGSDTTGTGESTSPYKTITYALSKVPKSLNGRTVGIVVAPGTYAEAVYVDGIDGDLQLLLQGDIMINSLTVTQSNLTIGSFTGSEVLLMSQWVAVRNSSRVFANASVNFNVTNKVTPTFNPTPHSIYCFDSQLYLSGIIVLTGNPDIGIGAYANSNVFLGTVTGGGMNIGIAADRSKIACMANRTTATTSSWVQLAGVLVNRYGARIGTLSSDVTIYVATTGSDTTGDGTNAKPYKTIQYAINTLPKDLGGYNANINIAAGTYDEDLSLIGLGHTGALAFMLDGTVTVNSITLLFSNAVFRSSDNSIARSLVTKYVLVSDNSSFNAYANVYVTTTGYYEDGGRRSIFIVRQSSAYFSGNTTLTGNTGIGISVSNTSQAYFYAIYGSGFDIGVDINTSSKITVYSNSLLATMPTSIATGGQIINSNGTQISGYINSGIACSWGSFSGGYIRHGNLNGVAMVTIQIVVQQNVNLTAGQAYTITGFPQASLIDVACAVNKASAVQNCYLRISSGSSYIQLTPSTNIATGTGGLTFNCTYLTNS